MFHCIHVPSLRQVALKSVRLGDNAEINKQIWQEIQTMYDNLERLNLKSSSNSKSMSCPHLVGFHGAYIDRTGSHIKMVIEFMDGGELQQLVRPPPTPKEEEEETMDPPGLCPPPSGTPKMCPPPSGGSLIDNTTSTFNISLPEPLLANIADRILKGLKFLHGTLLFFNVIVNTKTLQHTPKQVRNVFTEI